MTPIPFFEKSNDKEAYSSLHDWSQKVTPNFKLGDSVRTSDIRKVFSKGDSTKYSNEFYTKTEVIHDTIPSYTIDYEPERYNQTLLPPTKPALEQNNKVMEELNLIQ